MEPTLDSLNGAVTSTKLNEVKKVFHEDFYFQTCNLRVLYLDNFAKSVLTTNSTIKIERQYIYTNKKLKISALVRVSASQPKSFFERWRMVYCPCQKLWLSAIEICPDDKY